LIGEEKMASISYFPPRKNWRVSFTIYLRDGVSKKAKYVKSKEDAKFLMGCLDQLERKTKNRLAKQEEIEEWIQQKWLKEEDARVIFDGYTEAARKKKNFTTTNYTVLLDAYKEFWLAKTDREIISKNLGSDMSHARNILFWLEENCGELGNLTPDMVKEYLLAQKAEGLAENTIKNRLNIFRQLIDRAVVLDMIQDNPARQVNLKQVHVKLKGTAQETKRILRNEEIPILLEASLNHRELINGGLPTVVRLGLYAGLRNQEMCWFTWDAIDWQNRIIRVMETTCRATGETWKPKDYELRRLDVKQNFIDYLAEEKERQEREGTVSQFVIRGGNKRHPQYWNKPLQQDAPQKAFSRMVREEGLNPGITVYSLRHTYATMLLRPPPNGAGLDIKTVQQKMGHSDIKTTMTYLHYIEPEQHATDALPY